MVKKIFFLLFLAFLSSGVLKIYFFVQKGSWDGQNRLNLLFKGTPSYLVSLIPSEKQIIWLPLMEASKPEVLVDLTYDIANNCFHQEKQIKTCLLSQFYHRLNSWDNWRFWWYLWRVSPAQIIKVEKTTNYFRDEAIIKDDFSLVIINTTTHFGLASKMSQVITSAGGRVVRLADEVTNLPLCQIKTERRLADSYTVRKLKVLLRCQLIFGDVENERADIVIRLGEQNWVNF